MDVKRILTDASDEKSTVEDLLSIAILPITLFKTKQDISIVINEFKKLIIADYIIDDKIIDSNIAYLMNRAGFDYPLASDKITSYYYTTDNEKNINSNILMTHFTNSLYYIHKKIYSETNDNSIPLRKIKNAMNFFDSKLTVSADDYVKDGLEKISKYNGYKNKIIQYKDMKETVVKNISEKKQTNKNIINAPAQTAPAQTAPAQTAPAQTPVKSKRPNHNENTRKIIGEAIGSYIMENNGMYNEDSQMKIYLFYSENFNVEIPEISDGGLKVINYCNKYIENLQLIGNDDFNEDQEFDIKLFFKKVINYTINIDSSDKNNFDSNRKKIGMDLRGKLRALNNTIKEKKSLEFLNNKEIDDLIQNKLNEKGKELKQNNKIEKPKPTTLELPTDNKNENIFIKGLNWLKKK